MIDFELWTSGVRSNYSANFLPRLCHLKISFYFLCGWIRNKKKILFEWKQSIPLPNPDWAKTYPRPTKPVQTIVVHLVCNMISYQKTIGAQTCLFIGRSVWTSTLTPSSKNNQILKIVLNKLRYKLVLFVWQLWFQVLPS